MCERRISQWVDTRTGHKLFQKSAPRSVRNKNMSEKNHSFGRHLQQQVSENNNMIIINYIITMISILSHNFIRLYFFFQQQRNDVLKRWCTVIVNHDTTAECQKL